MWVQKIYQNVKNGKNAMMSCSKYRLKNKSFIRFNSNSILVLVVFYLLGQKLDDVNVVLPEQMYFAIYSISPIGLHACLIFAFSGSKFCTFDKYSRVELNFNSSVANM